MRLPPINPSQKFVQNKTLITIFDKHETLLNSSHIQLTKKSINDKMKEITCLGVEFEMLTMIKKVERP